MSKSKHQNTRTFDSGRITLIHGDSKQLIQNEDVCTSGINAICTDPPYGVSNKINYDRFTNGISKSNNFKTSYGNAIAGDTEPFSPDWMFQEFPNAKVCLWGFQYFASSLPLGSSLVWIKKSEKTMGTFLSDAELAWMKGGVGVYCFQHEWHGFIRASERGKKTLHPNQKPVALWEWVFDRMKLTENDSVLDPYMGCGSCGVACRNRGIKYLGFEIDSVHFKTACDRF